MENMRVHINEKKHSVQIIVMIIRSKIRKNKEKNMISRMIRRNAEFNVYIQC